jgi:hypothetical protein
LTLQSRIALKGLGGKRDDRGREGKGEKNRGKTLPIYEFLRLMYLVSSSNMLNNIKVYIISQG